MSDPWFKFYPTDWRSDPALRMCRLSARGLWIEMIALMHEATPYGHLLVSGRSPTDAQLAVLAGTPPEQITEFLGELEAAGVFSRTREGVIYSRKMTRLAKKAAIARKNGKEGGNPTLRKDDANKPSDKGGLKGQDKPQKPEARSQKDKEAYASPLDDTAQAVIAYNAAAARAGWPSVQRMTDARRKAIRGRLRECGGLDGWEGALAKAEASDFLCGRTAKPWTAFGFDWMTAPSNFTKIMEGNYDNRTGGSQSSADPTIRAIHLAAGMR